MAYIISFIEYYVFILLIVILIVIVNKDDNVGQSVSFKPNPL